MKKERDFMKSIYILALSLLAIAPLSAAPIRTLPNLTSVFIWEATTTNNFYSFAPNVGVNVQGNLPVDVLSGANEEYDLFYSNANGTFNLDGEYLTVVCNFTGAGQIGCNISAIGLSFSSGPDILFNTITNIRTGFNYTAGSENFMIDNDLETPGSLGNNSDAPPLSVTFGITAPSGNEVPEPSTYATLGAGLLAAAFLRRRNR
jgi:hypothetical protein